MMSMSVSKLTGDKPELKWVAVDKIIVDHNYQREIKPQRVAQILRDFTWSQFGALSLSEHDDGHFSVYDGQHRAAAARMHPDISEVPAVVVRVAGSSAEAEAFLGININRTAVSTVERYWAGLEAQDKDMIRVRDVLAAAGCEVIQAHGVKAAAHKTTAVTAVLRSIQRYGDEATTQACKALREAWPSDPVALSGVYIQALARILRNNRNLIVVARMVEKLRLNDRKQLAGHADALRKIGGGDATLNLSKSLVEIYNKGLQQNQISIGVKT
jgi:hypothetical protein